MTDRRPGGARRDGSFATTPSTPSPRAPEVRLPVHLWPADPRSPVVFLLDATSSLEERILLEAVAAHRPPGRDPQRESSVPIPPSRRKRRGAGLARLEAVLAAGEDPLLAPLRVVWRAPERDGERAVRFRDVLRFGDPRDPGAFRQRLLRRLHPDRVAVVAGEPARESELRERYRARALDPAEVGGFAAFVVRQAHLSLERAERHLRGARYKVPRFVREEILARPSFRGAIARIARDLGVPEQRLERRAAALLREIAATHNTTLIDLSARLIRAIYSRAYDATLHYDRTQLEAIYSLVQRYPVVFLPSHKSNLDHLVLQYALYENGLPPNHTAGGINMNFLPVGPLVRRSGVFFIRRSFRDDELYKLVLRSYLDYLLEKRFSLEWYIEGGRSRSGKLLPPRFGLLAYVADSYRRGLADDVILIPVSIAYDQISDVGDYAAEQRGGRKEKESFRWFLKFLRRLRRRYGGIHLRFGEPLSLRAQLGPPAPGAEPKPDEHNLALQKVAFEVCVRINAVTPITPVSLVTLALLGAGDTARTLEEIRASLRNLVGAIEQRKLPTTAPLDLEEPEALRRVLAELEDAGVVSRFDDGLEELFAIEPDQQLAAAYYRNTIIHFFVTDSLVELALVRVAEERPREALDLFFREVVALRDLLKFEFFFQEKEAFLEEVRQTLARHDAGFEDRLRAGGAEVEGLLRRIRPYMSHRVLWPFLDSYRVVADVLARRGAESLEDRDAVLRQALALGRQYLRQRRIRSPESVSRTRFEGALRLADHRGLLAGEAAVLAGGRRRFAEEFRAATRRVAAIDALAASRRAGLLV